MSARKNQQQKPEQKPDNGQAANDDPSGQPQGEQKTYSALDEAIKAEQEQPKEGEWQAGEEAANDDAKADRVGVQEIKQLAMLGFAVVGARYGDHWALSNDEAQGLAVASDKAMRHYLGNVEMGPGVALAVTAGMIVLPRVVVTMSMQQGPEKPEENQKETGTEGGAGGD